MSDPLAGPMDPAMVYDPTTRSICAFELIRRFHRLWNASLSAGAQGRWSAMTRCLGECRNLTPEIQRRGMEHLIGDDWARRMGFHPPEKDQPVASEDQGGER